MACVRRELRFMHVRCGEFDLDDIAVSKIPVYLDDCRAQTTVWLGFSECAVVLTPPGLSAW